MKIAILAESRASFVRPVAEGLVRMSAACGASAVIDYDGLETISLALDLRGVSPRSVARYVLRTPKYRKRFDDLVEQLRDADVIVVVAHVPASLSRHMFRNVEVLRARLPDIPIVNYDLIYLPTVEKWGRAMLRGEMSDVSAIEARLITPAAFGMERYDWYLVGSVASEVAMPDGAQPFSLIGIDIDDGTLYSDQRGEFRVLVDFEQTRKDYPSFSKVQLAALEQSRIPYEILDGRYTRSEIRAIYRRSGALLLAHRESFGLPICEVQACGCLVFTPRTEWAGAHWMKDDSTRPGAGVHSENFVVYENAVESLVDALQKARGEFDPEAVIKTFREAHPQLLHGDIEALSAFLSKVGSGAIHSRLHREHAMIGR